MGEGLRWIIRSLMRMGPARDLLVVLRLLLRVREGLVGRLDFFELLLIFGRDIGMVAFRRPSVGLLDVFRGRFPTYFEDSIVVLLSPCSTTRTRNPLVKAWVKGNRGDSCRITPVYR